MNLRETIEAYQPYNEQEERDRQQMLYLLDHEKDLLLRKNTSAHFSASAWVVSHDREHVLLCWHNIYRSWSWLGGHADGEEDLLSVAVREVREESGLVHVVPVVPNVFSLETLTVDGHIKNGAYVSSHLHLNLTYLLEADMKDPVHGKPDENSGVRWFTTEEALAACSEPWMVERVYRKLVSKVNDLEKKEKLS